MELLELLAHKCQMRYISDLKNYRNWQYKIEDIDPEDFSLNEWQDAIHYLCKTRATVQSAEQAKNYLIHWKK